MRDATYVVFGLLAGTLVGGCPQGAAVDNSGDGINDSVGGGGASTAKTGILISTPLGADVGLYDVYDETGTTKLEAAFGTGAVEEISAGTYVLRRYFNDVFIFATGVTVVPGAVTEIAFGAIHVTTVSGSNEATFDIWDAAGTTLLTRAESDNTILPVPPGTYVIKEYFNADFVWASNVQVVAGQVTAVPLGAFQLKIGSDWSNPSYDVFAADGVTLLSRPKSANVLVPLPAGSFAIFDYFNDKFPYVNVNIQAGAVTAFEMGAIQYNGSESNYDIYDASGTKLLDRPASRGDKRSVPPGTYVLKDYFSDVVLAAGVVVSAGTVTTVP